MFTILLFNTVRGFNFSSFPYCLFNFDPKYIIQRDSFLFFLQNTIITIITSCGTVVRILIYFCIKRFLPGGGMTRPSGDEDGDAVPFPAPSCPGNRGHFGGGKPPPPMVPPMQHSGTLVYTERK